MRCAASSLICVANLILKLFLISGKLNARKFSIRIKVSLMKITDQPI